MSDQKSMKYYIQQWTTVPITFLFFFASLEIIYTFLSIFNEQMLKTHSSAAKRFLSSEHFISNVFDFFKIV